MTALTADDVLAAINLTAARLPKLKVVIASVPVGHTWIIDPDADEIYIDGSTSTRYIGTVIVEALEHLCRHHRVPGPTRRLAVVPPPKFIQRIYYTPPPHTGTDSR